MIISGNILSFSHFMTSRFDEHFVSSNIIVQEFNPAYNYAISINLNDLLQFSKSDKSGRIFSNNFKYLNTNKFLDRFEFTSYLDNIEIKFFSHSFIKHQVFPHHFFW